MKAEMKVVRTKASEPIKIMAVYIFLFLLVICFGEYKLL